MLSQVLTTYFRHEGIDLNIQDLFYSESEILKDINNYLPSGVYHYEYHEFIYQDNENLPGLFVTEEKCREFMVLKNIDGILVNLSDNSIVNESQLVGCRIIYFHKSVLKKPTEDIYRILVKMVPKISFVSSFLIFFVILSPFYSNIFNTRLIYSDSFNTVLYVTIIFLLFLGFEILIKGQIDKITVYKIKNNTLLLNDYYISLLKWSGCRDASVKIKLIENSTTSLWRNYPLIVMDITIIMVFSLCVIFMLGIFSSFLLIYYVIFLLLCVNVRFKNYKHTLMSFEYSSEKMILLNSIEMNKDVLPFVNERSLSEFVKIKSVREEENKLRMHIDNHHWDELIKSNSFVSMVVMYCCCYFSVSWSLMGIGSIIAVLIINSRLSASIASLVSRCYTQKINKNHIISSLDSLNKNFIEKKQGKVCLSKVTNITLTNLTIAHSGKTMVNHISDTYLPGDVVGIYGQSGVGKTSLLKALSGQYKEYTGSITVSSIPLDDLSTEFFTGNMVFYSPGTQFFMGTLRENLQVHGLHHGNVITDIFRDIGVNFALFNGMLDDTDAKSVSFSSGEKQRLFLRMLTNKKAKILLLDEPTSFLAEGDGRAFMADIISQFPDAIVFIATHDRSLDSLMTKRIYLGGFNVAKNNIINVGTISVSNSGH